MRVEVKKIKQALSKLKPTINHNDKYENGKYIYLSNSMLMGYNEVIQMYYFLENGDEEFAVVLEAKELSKFLAKIKDTYLDIFKEKNKIVIKGAGVKYIIKENLSVLQYFQKHQYNIDFAWRELPDNFINGLRLVLPSVDLHPGFYNRVIVDDDKLYSTDSYRASKFIMDGSFNDCFCLHRSTCLDILKEDYTKYFMQNGIIYFSNEDISIIYRTPVDREPFKDVEEILRCCEGVGFSLVLPDNMVDYIDLSYIAVDAFINTLHQKITIKIGNNKMYIFGMSDKECIEINIDFICDMDELLFDINPVFFKDIVSRVQSIKIIDDIIMFYNANFIHIFALGE